MINTILPEWNTEGLLPSVYDSSIENGGEIRSPYRIDLASFMNRFAFSPARRKLCRKLLSFRKDLHQTGIRSGFQWLDGSFLENIEVIEQRDPRDIDVVTFYHPPHGENEESLYEKYNLLFAPGKVKINYAIDNYYHTLGKKLDATQVRKISYWYSMWGYRRDGYSKGFVEVSLDPSQDIGAERVLDIDIGDIP